MCTVYNVVTIAENVYDAIVSGHRQFQRHAVAHFGSCDVVSHLDNSFATFGERFQHVPMQTVEILTHVGCV